MKTIISTLIVGLYMVCCLRLRTAPWRYFQINARHFSTDKGIFSKISIDEMIPDKWKLRQGCLAEDFAPIRFPIFVKPEWGQNAQGITRADDADQLQLISQRLNGSVTRYIAQEAAVEKREFEIYTVFPDAARDRCAIITVTESINQTHEYPINSIYNKDTHYHDITNQFSQAQLERLIGYKKEIGRFGQSRLSVRADSLSGLVNGEFHVIELNLFTPMPINLLDQNYSWLRRLSFIMNTAKALAEATRTIDQQQAAHAVFTRMMRYSRGQKALGQLRSLL